MPVSTETAESILSHEKVFKLLDWPKATRKIILGLAQYTHTLEEEVGVTKLRLCRELQLEAAAEKLAKEVKRDIWEQLTVGFF